MKIEGTHTFAAPRDTVWPILLDPEVLANVLPGCEKLEQIGENKYSGVMKIRIGPVQGKFNGVVTLSEINAPAGYRIEVNGRGAPGFVKGDGSLRLAADDGSTSMEYEGTAEIGGRIASVGQRLLDTSARAIIRQSLEGLDQQIQAITQPDAGEGTATRPVAPVQPPSQAQFAAGVFKNMLEEMLPPEQQAALLSKALPILAALLLVLMIDQWRMNRLARKVAKRVSQNKS